jgi:hypothetical protein
MHKRKISKHAERRRCQRAISLRGVELALKVGTVIEQDGARIHFLGWRNLLPLDLPGQEKDRLEGTTVVVSRDGTVLTTWRSRIGPARHLRERGHRGIFFRRDGA